MSGGQNLDDSEESNTGQEKHALENEIPIRVVDRIVLQSDGAIPVTLRL